MVISVLSLVACVSGVTDGNEGSSLGAGATSSSAGANMVLNNGGSAPVGQGGGAPTSSAGSNTVGQGGSPVMSSGGASGGTAALEPCNAPAWVAKMAYKAGDKVTYNGAGYVASFDNPGYDPTISTYYWATYACTPVQTTGSGGSSGSTSTGAGGGPTNTTPNCPLNSLLANGSVTFDQIFTPTWAGHVPKPLYSYDSLCKAITGTAGFSAFANSGDMTKDRRELAAFFAHVAKETAFLEQSDEAGEASNAQDYHGRGAIQITGESNYSAAGQYLGKDLVGNPGLVSTDAVTNWQTALWFWMINYNPGTQGVQNCHQAILGGDFGQTTRIINGGIECPGSQAAQDRAQYYKNNCSTLGVDPGTLLVC